MLYIILAVIAFIATYQIIGYNEKKAKKESQQSFPKRFEYLIKIIRTIDDEVKVEMINIGEYKLSPSISNPIFEVSYFFKYTGSNLIIKRVEPISLDNNTEFSMSFSGLDMIQLSEEKQLEIWATFCEEDETQRDKNSFFIDSSINKQERINNRIKNLKEVIFNKENSIEIN